MEKNMTFDPMAWANNNANHESAKEEPRKLAAQVTNSAKATIPLDGELDKARAVTDELLQIGANIAESYNDYLQLGFALANGLGAEGRDIYHQLCAKSTKYRQEDCEKKWQECLRKNDGRTTIATFYKMAQDAGVDLSAISRQFPSIPLNPDVCQNGLQRLGEGGGYESYLVNNKLDIHSNSSPKSSPYTATHTDEGFRVLRENTLAGSDDSTDSLATYTETFSDKLTADDVPVLLRMPMMTQQETEDQDKVLLSALVLYSGNLPNVYGIYGEKRVYPPLYLIQSAPSGARKGIIGDCQQLLMPIEYDLKRQNDRAQDDYQRELAHYNALGKGKDTVAKPEEPKRLSLFVSANSSATSLYQDLADNNDRGTIFETEADTMTQALKQDYGNYSDGLRKAFHGERISYSRRKEHEHVCLEHPQLAIMMTCTPMQIRRLLPADEVENGLANRFLYYCLRGDHSWRNPFKKSGEPLEERINEVGKCFQQLYNELLRLGKRQLQVVLSENQQERFNAYFSPLLEEQTGLHGDSLDAFIYRMGLSAFRMMMVFTVLRCYERQPMIIPDEQALVCSDKDFQTVMTIINCLVNHTIHVYTNLLPHATEENPSIAAMSSQARTLYQALDSNFTTQQAFAIAKQLNIRMKTAEGYLGDYVRRKAVRRIRNGQYQKTTT